jgi:2-keto-4-pentenoate hydratase
MEDSMKTARSVEDEIAQMMLEARGRRATLGGGAFPELTDSNAYKVQERHMSMRYEEQTRLGWKIGYTSEAMRTQLNVRSPNYGPLWEPMLLSSGEAVAPSLIHPRVEPEIAVTFGHSLAAEDLPPTETGRASAIMNAISSYQCAIEVVDSIWSDYKFSWAENTADGSSAAHVVLGDFLPRTADLSDIRVTLEVDDVELSGRSEAVMGTPVRAIEWLIGALSQRGLGLEAGDIVLTGGITPSVALTPMSIGTARFATSGWAGTVMVCGDQA